MKSKAIDGAIWFDLGDQGVKCHLWMQIMAGINETGSISGTAHKLGTSYSKVYNEVVQLNCAADKKMVVSGRGGLGGGYAELTPEGTQVLAIYKEATKSFSQFILDLNQKLNPFF